MGTWHDIECGLHSGIPWCCVAFYVGREYWRKIFGAPKLWYPNRDGYVRCWLCKASGRLVEIQNCSCVN